MWDLKSEQQRSDEKMTWLYGVGKNLQISKPLYPTDLYIYEKLK